MNGQFLMNKAITVQYAFKKDGKGERHGTPAERLLAAQARKNNALPINARPPPAPIAFGDRPAMMPGVGMPYPPQGYQGQFAGVLAPPPPPMGFTPQQTMVSPSGYPGGMGGPPPPPPPGMFAPPPNGTMAMMPPGPPPPGFAANMMMMPPPGFMPPPNQNQART
jgi:splicing factor 3B subunit 4